MRRFESLQRLTFAVLAVLVIAPALSGAPIPDSPSPSPVVSASDVLAELNGRRADHGLRPLAWNHLLSLAASDRAGDLFAKRYFEHVSPDGIQPFVWVDARGYNYIVAGENLAVGQRTARQVIDEWMASPAHRKNILEPNYRDAGFAIVAGSPIGRTRGFTFVALFGARDMDHGRRDKLATK